MSSLALKEPQKRIETLQLTGLKAQHGLTVFICTRLHLQQPIFLGETDYVHKAADEVTKNVIVTVDFTDFNAQTFTVLMPSLHIIPSAAVVAHEAVFHVENFDAVKSEYEAPIAFKRMMHGHLAEVTDDVIKPHISEPAPKNRIRP